MFYHYQGIVSVSWNRRTLLDRLLQFLIQLLKWFWISLKLSDFPELTIWCVRLKQKWSCAVEAVVVGIGEMEVGGVVPLLKKKEESGVV
ncbi:hypothetical protein QVD17_11827 [Tagetes erecta]|uniref:Uncharacterized protein n=1 Tax=Tagetes erecta TaxID=13708 RepID=A0AAD8KV65_TARER|nr:hypothetical protein QVD17_11827 [Tagetes erecta]